jgi:Fe-S-cluster containining protein
VIHTVRPNQPEEAREFYRARTNYWKMAKDGRMLCYLEQPCVHLGKNGCKIYDERPKTCRDFPAVWNEWMEDYCELMRDKYDLEE